VAVGLVVWMLPDGEREGASSAPGERMRSTKPYPREREERGVRAKNPREEFEAARERGLTEEEVRGIVEEFVSLGITFENHQDISEQEYFEMGNKARDWYRDSLVEGFSLTPIQEADLTKILYEVGMKDMAHFQERRARFRDLSVKAENGELGLEAYGLLVEFGGKPTLAGNFGLWEASPQNMIDLDEQQREMIGCHDEYGTWIWVDGEQRTLDFGADTAYHNLQNPFSSINSIISVAGKVFPLSMEQADRLEIFRNESVSCHWPQVRTGAYLKQSKFLTAAQLRTLFVLRPDSSRQLMMDLGQ
jgi:hypothetical protein